MSLQRFTPALLDAVVDASALTPLLILITCARRQWTQVANIWCASEEHAVQAVARFSSLLRVAQSQADEDLPLASLQLSPHVDLPALVWIRASSLYVLSSEPARAPPPTSDAWADRIEEFIGRASAGSPTNVGEAFKPVRSAPPPPPFVPWADGSLVPRVSTASTLEDDLAAVGHCSLLLVHDASLDRIGVEAAAPTTKWRAVAAQLADRHPALLYSSRVLQLDVSRNDLPRSLLGAALGASLGATGVPAYVRVTANALQSEHACTFASVPARRMRASAALLNWASSHLQTCGRMDTVAPPALNITAAAATFVDEGVPYVQSALNAESRRLEGARVRVRAEALAATHAAVHERFQREVADRLHRSSAQPPSVSSAGAADDEPAARTRFVVEAAVPPPPPPTAAVLAAAEWAHGANTAIRKALEAAVAIIYDVRAYETTVHSTTHPRVLAHRSLDEAERQLIAYQALVDSGW